MIKILVRILIIISIISCAENSKSESTQQTEFKQGFYRAALVVQDNKELPFIFKVNDRDNLTVFNATEEIEVDEISYNADSVLIKMPAFEGYISAKFIGDDLEGSFIKESLSRIVPFKAKYGETDRFNADIAPVVDVSGQWEAVFSKGIPEDEYVAKGIFRQDGSKVTGTFRTTTGDYRFLEGVLNGDNLSLSAFDGAHAFLFTAKVTDSSMQGQFYSGNHFKEPFEAKRNDDFELTDANELTFLNEGYDSVNFSFPDTVGNMVSLEDERFKNKVVLVQIMGSWCPNCLDESKYYANYYKNNKDKDIEIVALAFEYAKTEDKAFASIDRLKEKVGIDYPILLAQYGSSSKIEAQKKLPMINHVLSYPTTIFIDKTGKVRKIHTGFNGPATGHKYEEFKTEFTSFIDTLLQE